MIVFDSGDYKKIIPIVRSADINTMFALSVLETKVKGKVFVDQKASPTSFYIHHPYGMALLCGETNNEDFYGRLTAYMLNLEKTRDKIEWLQVYPVSLYSKVEDILGANLMKKSPDEPYEGSSVWEADRKVLEYQRINFVFNKEKYLFFIRNRQHHDYKTVITSEALFYQLDGSVVPKLFWNDFSDFKKNGVGFTLLKHGVPISTAFSSFTIDNRLEIGIETSKDSRGSGFASIVCAKLMDYCLVNEYEPVWSCNSGNIGSRKLANKLGFEELIKTPYYRLPK
ncbi:MAG: GNAT family N-acetyltransferase [Syntrophomonas sp.]